jgi:hypothetical protein
VPRRAPNGFTACAPRTAHVSKSAFSTSISRKKAKDPEYAFLDAQDPVEAETGTQDPVAATESAIFPEQSPSSITEPLGDATPTPSPTAAAMPWYLRQQSAPRAPVQAAIIPDLPINPPPILSELLEYIAVTAGLDDLTLLDLRDLDPPPALGPKLIMLLATARSERHLHVSADRFARWLRRASTG